MLIDDLRIVAASFVWGESSDEQIEAYKRVHEAVAAYDALEPDWAQAPEWAQWHAIDADGIAVLYDAEPTIAEGMSTWDAQGQTVILGGRVCLSLGIDWRLCKWRRS